MTGPDIVRPSRHSIRLREYDYRQPGAYFITINAYRRRMLFGQIEEGKAVPSKIGKIIRSCWEEIPLHFPSVEIDEFVVMPNHVHGIIVINGAGAACCAPTSASEACSPSSLSAVVRSFKSSCSRCVSRLCLLRDGHLWQRNYYEHIVRNDADLNDVREYILNNPARWSQDEENPDPA